MGGHKDYVLAPDQKIRFTGPSLADQAPDVARLWHRKKNGTLEPHQVGCSARAIVWWECGKGHEWQLTILRQVRRVDCPYCDGYYVTEENSLLAKCPEIAKEWHPKKNRRLWFESGGTFKVVMNMRIAPENKTRNRRLKPSDVLFSSPEVVWWQCARGHEWKDRIYDRTVLGQHCKACKKVEVATSGSLAVLNPGLAKLWHPTRNVLTPADVIPGASAVVWWRCPKNASHVWDAPVKTVLRSQTVSGTHGCPYCSHHRVDQKNSLAAKAPKAAKLWHPTKNNDLTPSQVAAASKKRAYWQCSLGHEWDAVIGNVVTVLNLGRGACPECAKVKVVPKGKSLKDVFPEIASMWHPTKNGKLKPSEVSTGSIKEIHWVCRRKPEHEFVATVNCMTKLFRRGTKNLGCQQCRGRAESPEKSLLVMFPDIYQYWDTERNLPLGPGDVKPRSSKRVWWICAMHKQEKWQGEISNFTKARQAGKVTCKQCKREGNINSWRQSQAD